MSKTVYTAICISNINLEGATVDFSGTSLLELDGFVAFLVERDLSRYAIFKDYKHIQIPLNPTSTDVLRRIIIQS